MSTDPTPTSRAAEDHVTPCPQCNHGIKWHHDERGCDYLGPTRDKGCPCALSIDAAIAGLLREQEPSPDPGWRIVEQADRADALASMIADAREALARRKGRMAAACEEAVEHLSRAPFSAAHKSRADHILATRDGSPRPVGVREQEPAQGGLTEAEREAEARGRDHCPTCGVSGRDGECATPTGRDHPARRHYRMGFDTAAQLMRGQSDLAARGGTAAAGDDRPWRDCTGAGDCPERWHVHGCYADAGQCDDPTDHHTAAVGDEGLHACEGCGLELDADDRNARCEDCTPTPTEGTAAAGDEGLRERAARALASCSGCFEPDHPCGDLRCDVLRDLLDATPAPTEAPAPSQDTLRTAVEQIMKRAQMQQNLRRTLHGPAVESVSIAELAGICAAALAATTPEATGRGGVEG